MGGTTAKVVKKADSAVTKAKKKAMRATNSAKATVTRNAALAKQSATRNASMAKRQAKWAAQFAKTKLAYKPPKVNIGGTAGDLLKKGKSGLSDASIAAKKNADAAAANVKRVAMKTAATTKNNAMGLAVKTRANLHGVYGQAKGLWDQARGKGQGVNTVTDDTTATAGVGGLNPGKAQENTGKTSKNSFEMADMSKKSAVKVSGKGKRALRKLTA